MKNNQVFLSAEDCAKIAPYVEVPEEWEWWYIKGKLCNDNGKSLHVVDCKYGSDYSRLLKHIPALDCGILGEIFQSVENISFWLHASPDCDDEERGVYLEIYDEPRNLLAAPSFHGKSELQNRRDAIMYLIDNKLISPSVKKTLDTKEAKN